jgi:hypothetical protein
MILRVAAAFLLTVTCWAGDAPNPALEALKADVGSHGWAVIDGADSVEVRRIEPDEVKPAPANSVAGHKEISRGKDGDAVFTSKLRAILVEGQGAPSEPPKSCAFQPGVAFTFVKGTDRVELLLCFTCNEFEIVSFPPKAPEPIRARRWFDAYRAAFVRIAQAALPDDEVVKGLKAWTWEPNADAVKQVGGHASKLLMAAESVEVYRIEPKKGDPTAAERQVAGGYPVISQGADRGPAFAARIATRLLQGLTQPGFDKLCSFEPGVVFVVKSQMEHVTLVLCFTCDELQTQAFPPKAPEPVNGQFDMDSSRGPWLELAKQALPGDETIQSLGDKPK